MISFIFLALTAMAGGENEFTYNNWNYGECAWTAADAVMSCKNKDRVCMIDFKAINDDGYQYTKFAGKEISDGE